jgi:hypothetical protein
VVLISAVSVTAGIDVVDFGSIDCKGNDEDQFRAAQEESERSSILGIIRIIECTVST